MCLLSASNATHVPPDIVMSIIMVEGGRAGVVSNNKDSSQDLGVMQINTKAWLHLISDRLYDGNDDIAYNTLKDNACLNIKIGTWILSRAIREANGDIWSGVGIYHSHNKRLSQAYMQRVKSVHYKLFIE
ncbi:lytic transglycosylase domain-containing protein [Serratia sp. UGAL515B_01]|uniref:lytic transglycosylase domain-containing protein n=1 Tax=Serratia sp. UGAL515B_01 TaxID=2986763 RepID=UPI002955DA01|nr:lytic transglycosylase domain-containing protein [Serratia sp. UGAL515B_01]WON79012.1 lytic transglycosylase domain-containing protein [Serratia sp. UGAL515B_01]